MKKNKYVFLLMGLLWILFSANCCDRKTKKADDEIISEMKIHGEEFDFNENLMIYKSYWFVSYSKITDTGVVPSDMIVPLESEDFIYSDVIFILRNDHINNYSYDVNRFVIYYYCKATKEQYKDYVIFQKSINK